MSSTGPTMQPGADPPPAAPEAGAFLPGMAQAPHGHEPTAAEPSGLIAGRSFGIALLSIVVTVAGAALWGMRKLGLDLTLAVADLPAIDYPIEEAGAEVIMQEREELLADLNSSGNFPQVPLDQVQMNPFTLKGSDGADVAQVDAMPRESEAERLARERAERHDRLRKTAHALRVNSVMAGPNPLAVVSGKMVAVGDLVAEQFRVAKIEGRSVVLDAVDDDLRVTISMAE